MSSDAHVYTLVLLFSETSANGIGHNVNSMTDWIRAGAQGPCCHGQCRLSGSRTQEPIERQSTEGLSPLLGGQPSLTIPLNPPSRLEDFGPVFLPEDSAVLSTVQAGRTPNCAEYWNKETLPWWKRWHLSCMIPPSPICVPRLPQALVPTPC